MSRTSRKSPSETTHKDHDEQGRFTKGNCGGPGKPFNRRMAEMRRLIQSAISDERLLNIINQIATKAEMGDLAAAKLLLPYLVGRTPASRDPDRVEEEDWERRKRRPDAPELAETVNRVDFGIANALAVGYDVMHEQQMVEEFKKGEKAQAEAATPPRVSAKRQAVDDVKQQTKKKFDWREFDPEEWEPTGHVIDEVLREEWLRNQARRNGRLSANGNGKHVNGKHRNGDGGRKQTE